MKIEYGRNSQSSFVRIFLDGEIQKTEEAMLSRNNIEGLLETKWQKEDKGYILRYNITGKQALDMMLENTIADEHLLENLVQGICSLCRRVERFLLSQDGIILEPEMIYWDGRNEKFYFCYYPGENGNFQDKFLHLMEYLLTKTDHKNVRAVEMVYGVYETLMQEGGDLNQIQYDLERIRKSWKDTEEIKMQDNSVNIMDEITAKDNFGTSYEKNVIKRILEWCKKRMNAWIKPEVCEHLKQKKKNIEFVFEPEEEPEKMTTPTVLLSLEKQDVQGVLRYEGNDSFRDIYISKIPFSIGSGEGCDGIINDVTVSRKHAMITKIDEVYFIEDMNSSNGTRVEGEFVSYKAKTSLKKNDIVQFSNQRYRFI